jgi:hypothetical protein
VKYTSGSPVEVHFSPYAMWSLNETDSVAQLASYPIGMGGSFTDLKQPEREADHTPPSSV